MQRGVIRGHRGGLVSPQQQQRQAIMRHRGGWTVNGYATNQGQMNQGHQAGDIAQAIAQIPQPGIPNAVGGAWQGCDNFGDTLLCADEQGECYADFPANFDAVPANGTETIELRTQNYYMFTPERFQTFVADLTFRVESYTRAGLNFMDGPVPAERYSGVAKDVPPVGWGAFSRVTIGLLVVTNLTAGPLDFVAILTGTATR